jgi:hypothetical protein
MNVRLLLTSRFELLVLSLFNSESRFQGISCAAPSIRYLRFICRVHLLPLFTDSLSVSSFTSDQTESRALRGDHFPSPLRIETTRPKQLNHDHENDENGEPKIVSCREEKRNRFQICVSTHDTQKELVNVCVPISNSF